MASDETNRNKLLIGFERGRADTVHRRGAALLVPQLPLTDIVVAARSIHTSSRPLSYTHHCSAPASLALGSGSAWQAPACRHYECYTLTFSTNVLVETTGTHLGTTTADDLAKPPEHTTLPENHQNTYITRYECRLSEDPDKAKKPLNPQAIGSPTNVAI